jgi:DNA-binding GntR family transcriptional regulator
MSVLELLPSTVSERSYERIRADIVFGRLAPGARLKLDRLSADYVVSVSTLREILNRLASEGLILAEDQRGFRVMPATAADFQDVAAMRLLLESHAIRLSFGAGDLEWEGRVVAAHHKLAMLERRMMAGDRSAIEAWKTYDREFHRALIDACRSEMVLDLYCEVFDKYLRYQMVADVFRGEIAATEHEALQAAALSRDADAACAILERHVNGCLAHTLSLDVLG